MTLRTIADKSKGIVFEVVLELGEWPVGAFVDHFLRARKIERFNTTNGLCREEKKTPQKKEKGQKRCGVGNEEFGERTLIVVSLRGSALARLGRVVAIRE